ncbi:hypothetical protein FGG08_001157 [Glutinoglossum americanum]|uniref:Uncharacterized protein n=1 Tax=Glutinoglossum americanum TaxID=1670608 RepID=A0A9P8I8N8_9PEZI|nr:hypothetical protein FGG08_001157 [Glutinoglossum americanum]
MELKHLGMDLKHLGTKAKSTHHALSMTLLIRDARHQLIYHKIYIDSDLINTGHIGTGDTGATVGYAAEYIIQCSCNLPEPNRKRWE